MGFDERVLNGGPSSRWSCLTRRKPVNSEAAGAHGGGNQQLARTLTLRNLLGLGVGSTIGAGVYVLIGTVAREHTGPLLLVSFIIAGVAAALSALCYAELSSRCPSAGSAYHYAYICVGEGVAWLIGWALILEYTIGGSAVARGISPNLALFFGGPDSLPAFLSRAHVPGIDIVVDPCAAFLVLAVTVLLSLGIKESSFVQSIVTVGNVVVMLFVFVVGTYLDVKSGFPGYPKSGEWLPFGFNGLLAGSATLFFAFIGFDSVASTAEEVENPQRDLPIGIGASLSICCMLYVLVSWAVVGLVKYDAMDPDTPISSAFTSHGMQWAMYVVTSGAVTALCATLMGSLIPQPRILMAMARDGLLPPFFSDVDSHTQVPLKSTIATGLAAATLAFLMNVDELAGMVSVGTLLAFTTVAISILILRYIPPVTAPVPAGMQKAILKVSARRNEASHPPSDGDSVETPLVANANSQGSEKVIQIRRRIAAHGIVFACIGVVMLAAALTAAPHASRSVEIALCVTGGLLLVCSLAALYAIGQDSGRHSFGNSGGFVCPLVPLLPIGCVFINTYLLVNLSGRTWLYVAVWLVVGVVVYLFYGRKNSKLVDVVYVPNAIVEEIYREEAEKIGDS